MTDWVTVSSVADFKPGTHKNVDIDGTNIAVFNLDGSFYAIEDVCTHDGNCLTGGEMEGCEIICPRHGARFDIRTGAALTAPAYEPTAVFPVRIVNGEVQVRDDRWD